MKFAAETGADTILVATEPHIIHQMQKAHPEKTYIGVPGADGNCNCNDCPFMAMNSVDKLYTCLRDLSPQISVDEKTRQAALAPLNRMLEMSPKQAPATDLSAIGATR